jgi:hypothetical protein
MMCCKWSPYFYIADFAFSSKARGIAPLILHDVTVNAGQIGRELGRSSKHAPHPADTLSERAMIVKWLAEIASF